VSIDLSESALAQCHGVGGISAPLRAAGCGHGCVCLSAYHFQRERERENVSHGCSHEITSLCPLCPSTTSSLLFKG